MQVNGEHYRTVWLDDTRPTIHMIDQTLLPFDFRIYDSVNSQTTAEAIRNMTVRGAGAIGATAGYGMFQGFAEGNPDAVRTLLESTRPTAKNLTYATERVYNAGVDSISPYKAAREEAEAIAKEDVAACRQIGLHGAELIEDGNTVLTHCNAGWLAFVDYGSALSPVYTARDQGKRVKVFADETRPRQQGARLTAWELSQEEIEHEIVADTGAASLISRDLVDLIIVGADRIAANGDTANKIGTCALGALARLFDIPFYVAAPLSTFDLDTPNGSAIEIEQRDSEEVTHVTGRTDDGKLVKVQVTNPGSPVRNEAFDVTPARFITGFITPVGIVRPRESNIRDAMSRGAA